MIKSKNIILYEILAVLVLFTIIYFVAVNKASYAFSYDESSMLYESKISHIDKMALLYGENNPDLFAEDDTIYITVADLVAKEYIVADDDEGNVKDPTSDVKLLNDIKIRITAKDGKVSTKILS